MSKTFKCPSCGGPLDYDGGEALTVRCPFCSNSVIVPEELRQARAAILTPPAPAAPATLAAPATPAASPTAPPQTLDALRAEIKATRQAGREKRRALRHQLREARHREQGK